MEASRPLIMSYPSSPWLLWRCEHCASDGKLSVAYIPDKAYVADRDCNAMGDGVVVLSK